MTTGGPIETWRHGFATHAERSADYLRRHGLVEPPVVALPAPPLAQERTFLSAVVVRNWARGQGIALDAVDLFSSDVHARRSRLAYRLALGPGVEVGILAAAPRRYELDRWWQTSEGAKSVLGEVIGLAWTKCCFWPEPAGSHNERWAVPKSPA